MSGLRLTPVALYGVLAAAGVARTNRAGSTVGVRVHRLIAPDMLGVEAYGPGTRSTVAKARAALKAAGYDVWSNTSPRACHLTVSRPTGWRR